MALPSAADFEKVRVTVINLKKGEKIKRKFMRSWFQQKVSVKKMAKTLFLSKLEN
jgi:hypothetical protein